jgi:hypothetical protein
MSCDCGNYIDCGDKPVKIGVVDDAAGYTHSVKNKSLITNLPGITFLENTERDFSVTYGWDRDNSISHYITCDNDDGAFGCGGSTSAVSSSHCADHCIREINTPYYLDRQNGIFIYKNIKEELSFDISSHKTAAFKMKFGTSAFHKICIPNTVKAHGSEKFVLIKNGVEQILASQTYEYNPFPAVEGGGTTWGLYGGQITRSAIPDTPNVACILLFPTVGKQAIPLDNDVIAYGFYDYNSVEGGFTESSLPHDDGGKDYFYPYWCRQMPQDNLWRTTANQRYEVIYSGNKLNLAGTTPWYAAQPTTYDYPFGSFALDSKEAFVYSCILQFSDRCDKKGVVVNGSSFGDLYDAIYAKHKITPGKYNDFYPVSPL